MKEQYAHLAAAVLLAATAAGAAILEWHVPCALLAAGAVVAAAWRKTSAKGFTE
jgi:hypothetical protein